RNEPELAPLAHVTDVDDLHVAPGHLRLELRDAEVLDPGFRLRDHLADGLLRSPRRHPVLSFASQRNAARAPAGAVTPHAVSSRNAGLNRRSSAPRAPRPSWRVPLDAATPGPSPPPPPR